MPPKPARMTRPRALRIAVRAMQAQAKFLAFDANMAERAGATYPQAVSASRERQLLHAAIAELKSK